MKKEKKRERKKENTQHMFNSLCLEFTDFMVMPLWQLVANLVLSNRINEQFFKSS